MGWITTVTKYEPVKYGPVVKQGKRVDCDKRTRRQITFQNTISPFNKNPETGEPRTWQEIRDKLKADAKAWQEGPLRCAGCDQAERQRVYREACEKAKASND